MTDNSNIVELSRYRRSAEIERMMAVHADVRRIMWRTARELQASGACDEWIVEAYEIAGWARQRRLWKAGLLGNKRKSG